MQTDDEVERDVEEVAAEDDAAEDEDVDDNEVYTFECGLCLCDITDVPVMVEGDRVCRDCAKEFFLRFEKALQFEYEYPVTWQGEIELNPREYEDMIETDDMSFDDFIKKWDKRVFEYRTPGKKRLYCGKCEKFIGRRVPTRTGGRECPQCYVQVCARCGKTDHFDSSCQPAEDDKEELPEIDGKESRRCPYEDCAQPGSLYDGCNEVKCGSCHRKYCWVCMKTNLNSDHWSNGRPCPRFGKAGMAGAIFDLENLENLENRENLESDSPDAMSVESAVPVGITLPNGREITVGWRHLPADLYGFYVDNQDILQELVDICVVWKTPWVEERNSTDYFEQRETEQQPELNTVAGWYMLRDKEVLDATSTELYSRRDQGVIPMDDAVKLEAWLQALWRCLDCYCFHARLINRIQGYMDTDRQIVSELDDAMLLLTQYLPDHVNPVGRVLFVYTAVFPDSIETAEGLRSSMKFTDESPVATD